MKNLLFTAVILFSGMASAEKLTSFDCTSKLDYTLWENGKKVVKTVDFRATGNRTSRNTLRGGVWIEAGHVMTKLNLPSVMLSDNVVSFKGHNLKDKVSVNFTFMTTSNGEQNLSNTVTVKVGNRLSEIASNDRISLDGEDLGNYPVYCDIE